MNKHLKLFANHSAYSQAESSLDKPNVAVCQQEGDVHYNPWVETRLVATFNVTNTSNTTRLASNITNNISEIEIDNVIQPSVVGSYTFNTTGEHIVKYTLTNPTNIGDRTFYNCSSLTNIIIPNNVTNIGVEAFLDCSNLTSVIIPDSITSIGSFAFNRTGLTNITVDSNNSTYDSRNNCNAIIKTSTNTLIKGCNNTIIPNTVTSIGDAAFNECSFTNITIPDSVTSIKSGAFQYCENLTSITIPSSVTSIDKAAFLSCDKLANITCLRITAPTIQSSTFKYVKTNGILTVPSGSTGYDTWMGTGDYYLGKYNWTKVEQ